MELGHCHIVWWKDASWEQPPPAWGDRYVCNKADKEYVCSLWAGTNCLNSEETTQLRRKATWEKGPTTKPRTRDLRSNAEFQPRELQNRPRSFVPQRRLNSGIMYALTKVIEAGTMTVTYWYSTLWLWQWQSCQQMSIGCHAVPQTSPLVQLFGLFWSSNFSIDKSQGRESWWVVWL